MKIKFGIVILLSHCNIDYRWSYVICMTKFLPFVGFHKNMSLVTDLLIVLCHNGCGTTRNKCLAYTAQVSIVLNLQTTLISSFFLCYWVWCHLDTQSKTKYSLDQHFSGLSTSVQFLEKHISSVCSKWEWCVAVSVWLYSLLHWFLPVSVYSIRQLVIFEHPQLFWWISFLELPVFFCP